MTVFVLRATFTNWETMDTVKVFSTREKARRFATEYNLEDYVIEPHGVDPS